ncbi:MAG: anti-sigma factor [Burkholderiaceae bacterium]
MNIGANQDMLDRLASEYALGTLKGGARRRYEFWLQRDPVFQRATAEWQGRLNPMAEFSTPVRPPPQVWKAIADRLSLGAIGSQQRNHSFWRGLRNDLSFWRGLGLTSSALAAILVAVLATRAPMPVLPVTSYVAMLADDRFQPVAVVTGDAVRHQLTVRVVRPQTVGADKSLELWAVSKAGSARSLGLIASNGSSELPLPSDTTPQTVGLLAISLEPKGGSPNPNSPSGPVVFKGAWVSL